MPSTLPPSLPPPSPSSNLPPQRHLCHSFFPYKTQKPHLPSPPLLTQNLQLLHPHTTPQETSPPKPKLSLRTRLSQLCKDGRLEIALRIFEAIPHPPTLLWNTLIIGFICNAMPHDALRLYARMNSLGIASKPDFYTFSSALKACADSRQLKLGASIHCRIIRSQLNPSRVLGNSLLNMYSNCFEGKKSGTDVVHKVFDTMRKRNVVTWNTVIAWYSKMGRPNEALTHFKLLMGTGIRLSVVSFINVLPAVAGIQDGKLANVIYGLLLKFGCGFSDDLFAVSCAIFMFCEVSDVDSARRVFDLCVERNVEVWNTMIDGYVQNDRPGEALKVFLEVANSELVDPDDITFLAALMAISQIQQLEFGRQVHAYMIKCLAEFPVILFNALIVMYSRCNSVETAFVVFDKMTERDIVSWNTMASAFVQNGFDTEGVMLIYEMRKRGISIDLVTATALLSAASNLRNLRIGKQTHAYLFRHGIKFEGMDSYLIDMYAKSGLIETAERLFKRDDVQDRDQVTWNAMIAGYSQNGQIDEAVMVLKQMIAQNHIPSSVTLASILPACNPMGELSLGKQLHGYSIRHFLDKSVFVGTALVDMYAKCGMLSHAETLFSMLPHRNSVTYTTMILGFGQHGLGEKALSLFYAMPKAGMKPDAVTYVAVLSACSYSGLVEEGLSIFESMEIKDSVHPTFEHYSCVVDMLGRAGRVREAYDFVQEMGDEGNVVGILGSLLGACRIHGELSLGKLVAQKLLEMENRRDDFAGYHVLLSNMYAEEGKWESVDGVRKGMREKGLRKEVGCSWIEVGGIVHCFVCRERRHPMTEEIYGMLEELAEIMRLAGYKPGVGSDMDVLLER